MSGSTAPKRAADGPVQPAERRTILVVEDDTDIREALVDGLVAAGFLAPAAEDGVRAMELIEEGPPDLILLDLMLPRMTGWQLMEHLREDPALQDIPIVVVTAARYAGSVHPGAPVFIKPLRMPRLIQSLRAFLG